MRKIQPINLNQRPTDLETFLKENYQEKDWEYLQAETGLEKYTLKQRAKKLGIHRGSYCEFCGKRTYKRHDGTWICQDCYYNIRGSRCIDCGEPIGSRYTRCFECARRLTGEKNKKSENKCLICGRPIWTQWKTCHNKQCSEQYRILKGITLERFCIICGKRFLVSRYKSTTKAAIYCSQKCYKIAWFPPLSGKKVFKFGKTKMRSSWEAEIAKLLSEANIKFEYEPKKFGNYIPDFYLPEENIWIEVKGFMTEAAKEKIDNFQKEHTILLIEEEQYNKLISKSEEIVQLLKRSTPAMGLPNY